MSRADYVQFTCECEACVVANTSAVRLAARPGKSIVVLHGVDATRYLESQRRGTERVGEIGARLRADLLKGLR